MLNRKQKFWRQILFGDINLSISKYRIGDLVTGLNQIT